MKNDERYRKADAGTGQTCSQFRRRLLPALVASCFACGPVYANPTGGQVVNGQATITSSGNTLTITNTPGTIINWLSFSINPGQITQFLQQSSSSAVLNRIVGQNPSQIFGMLESNGKVFLINPNGILFEPGSQTNVGGLVASTLDISNTDFIAGKNNLFSSVAAPGSVVNQGAITTPNGGNIYLIAPQVQNSGVLTSPQGEILLAAGHSVQLVDGADPNIQVVISSAADKVTNLGQVVAQGGKVGIYGAFVNQTGTVKVDSAVVDEDGEVVFKSSQSTLLGQNSVTSATGSGKGGTIEVLGPNVEIVDNALLDASGNTGGGKVMVGGDFHGADKAIPDSTTVFIGADSMIKADALQSGDGGKVAVWSDNSTLFFGNISALGGAQGGNGGYVETSGKYNLEFDGTVDLKAPYGTRGTLLLDPYAIVITSDNTLVPEITPTAGPPAIYISPIASYVLTTGPTGLNYQLSQSNVLIETGATAGTITVASPVTWTAATTLSLVATSDITVGAAITGNAGTLSLNSISGNITQSSPISVLNLAAVANAGYVNLSNPLNSVATIAGSAGGGNGFVFVNSGPVTIGSVGGYTNGSFQTINGIAATVGSVNLQSTGTMTISQPVSSPQTVYLTSTTGNITQTSSGTVTAGNLAAYAPAGYVALGTAYNSVSGTVAGASSGAFSFLSNSSFGVGNQFAAQSGISSATSVTLTSTGGSIFSSGSGAITAPTVSLSAYSGIGAQGAALNTATNSLTLSNGCSTCVGDGQSGGIGDIVVSNNATGTLVVNGIAQLNTTGVTGNIILTNTNTINIGGPVSAPNGNIGIYSAGNINVSSGITAGALSGGNGNIGLTSTGGNIAIAAPINAAATAALQATGNIYESTSCTCTPTITAGNLAVVSSGGYVSLMNAGNAVGSIAGSAGGASDGGTGFAFTNGPGFTVGSIGGIGAPFSPMGTTTGVSASSGSIGLYASSGPILIGAAVNAGSNNITINATQAYGVVQAAGGSITTTGNLYLTGSYVGASGASNALVTNVGSVSISSGNDVFVQNTGTSILNLNGLSAGGVVNISTAGGLDVTYSELGVSASSLTLVSGGNMVLANNNYNVGGAIALYAGFTETPGSAPVANLTTSSLTQSGFFQATSIDFWANSYNDFLTSGTPNFYVPPTYHPSSAPIDVTVTGTTVTTKTYDGKTVATLTGGTLVGIPAGDLADVTFTQSGTFSSKDVGNAIPVTATDTLTLSAALAGDFILVEPTGLTGSIVAAQLTVVGQTATKIYDGTTNALISGGTLSGVVAGDTVSLVAPATGQYATRNAGHNIAVTLSSPDALTGTDAGNYLLVQPAVKGTINPLALTVTGETAADKNYDGTTTATVKGGTLVGVLPSDANSVSLNLAGNFANAGPGNSIPVVFADTLSGAAAGNYTINQPLGVTANIMAPVALLQDLVTLPSASYIAGLNTTLIDIQPGNKESDHGASGSSGTTNPTGGTKNVTSNLYCN